ncbi:MAG TPA: zinc-binding alcohol dehydrogenase family protein [Trebonia sp.]|jgi:NADPH:quinone reductase-like Zn-dependent oxidoreductase|nr:zinc-binding alcohol dehydrogenase family protein [Trebonia sp.]
MKAAVVTSFGEPPRYADFAEPVPAGEHDLVVDVITAGLHPRVRSQADGSHYTSTGELPLVPGVDGVGRGADGALRYFALDDTTAGSMAERTVIDARRSIVLPAGTDPVMVAAGMNPAMSSWVALRRRAAFTAGQGVLVLGATGSAGRMAVQVARLLGAGQVIAAGRDAARLAALPALGAAAAVRLGPDGTSPGLGEAAAGVDVVIDYLWGQPAASAMAAIVTARPDRRRPLTWISVGSMAGLTAPLPSAALRAARLQVIGSGQGSVGPGEFLAELPALAAELSRGTFAIAARPAPLAEVEQAWADAPATADRIVLVP